MLGVHFRPNSGDMEVIACDLVESSADLPPSGPGSLMSHPTTMRFLDGLQSSRLLDDAPHQ